jgi:NADPH:quinone reductase-like Zn-dependent oxidoreductase
VQAIVYERYGSPDVLHLGTVEKPVLKDDEALVKVRAASVNAGDWHLMRGSPFMVRFISGLLKPKDKILGVDIAGTVEAVGSNVRQLEPGDEVFGDIYERGSGGFAEYACAAAEALVSKPVGLTFEEAAAVPSAAVTALQGLRDEGQIQPGQKVLVNGASGGVGTFAVQIAKSFGAEVTGVCSTRSVQMVSSIGADRVIDYKNEDFTRNGQRYDLILDTAAYRPISDYRGSLNSQGKYILVGGSGRRFLQVMLAGPRLSKKGAQRFGTFLKKPKREDLEYLKELLEAGRVKPVIDRCYSLREVSDAVRYVEEGHTQGKVVITVEHPNNN